MKMKNLISATLAVAFGLTLAGAASAGNTDINVYGASAQFNFWSQEAAVWLASPTGGNCTGGVVQSSASGITAITGLTLHGQKYFYAQGSNCSQEATGGTITVRVVAGDSFDGLEQVTGNPYPFDSVVPGGHLDPLTCAAGTRTMLSGTNLAAPAAADTACYPVTLGASDVTPDIFTQLTTTSGHLFDGPSGATASWGPINVASNPVNMGTLNHYQPVVVPFGLWLNNAVTLQTCTGEAAGKIDAGTPCTAGTQCSSGACGAAAPVTNLSLEWISQIFSGQVKHWNDLNSAFSAEPIVMCLRVPGSGTLATLDYALLKRTGVTLPEAEKTGSGSAKLPNVYFNFTSGDLEKCVETETGAIGILDADDSKVPGNGGYGPVAVNGQMPTRTNIRTGLYDYFTVENLYENATCAANGDPSGDCHNLVENFVNFANVPANITASGRSLYASSAEMLVSKTGAGYPTVRTTATGGIPGAASLCSTAGAVTTDAGLDPLSNICESSCSAGSCQQQICANVPGSLCP